MSSPDKHIGLPLDPLFSLLEVAGFDVTPASRVRAWRVLSSAGLRASLDNPALLRGLLAPVFARSAEQQLRFYEVFDRFVESISREPEPPPPPPKTPFLKKYRHLLALTALALAALLAYFLWPKPAPSVIPEPSFSFNNDIHIPGDMVQCNTSALEGLPDSALLALRWELLRSTDSTPEPVVMDSSENTVSWLFVAPAPAAGTQFSVRLSVRYTDNRPDSSGARVRTGESVLPLRCAHPPAMPRLQLPAGTLSPGQQAVFAVGQRLAPGLACRWEITGEGASSRTPRLVHRFAEKGLYEVSFSLTDTTQQGEQCSADTTFFIRVGEEEARLAYLPLLHITRHPGFTPGWLSWLILALLLIPAMYFWWRWSQRKPPPPAVLPPVVPPVTPGSDRPPYYIPYRQQPGTPRTAREQYRLADALRRRQLTDDLTLDVPATLRATIDRGGYPAFRYRYKTRPSEYLVVVDEQIPGRHLVRLFRHLAETLRGQDVVLDIVWCDPDMQHFRGAGVPPGASADTLRRYFPAHRLVVLGTAHALIETGAPRLRPDAKSALAGWPQRLLLTPQPPADWNWREALLYRQFGLFPSDLRGMLDAATFVENGLDTDDMPAEFSVWRDRQIELRSDENTSAERQWRSLADHLDYLKPFDSRITDWFLALAVHPAPAWEITLAIALKLGITPTHDSLLALARIPALRDGSLNPGLRRDMLGQLGDDLEKPARQAVLAELEAIRHLTDGSHVSEETDTYIIVQKFLLEPDVAENRQALGLLLDSGAVSRGIEMELNRFVQRRLQEEATMSKAGGFNPGIREWLKAHTPEPEAEKPLPRPFDTPDLRRALLCTVAALCWVLWLWQVCTAGSAIHQFFAGEYRPFTNESHNSALLRVRQPDHLAGVFNNLGVLASELAPRPDYETRPDTLLATADRLLGHLGNLDMADSSRQRLPWQSWRNSSRAAAGYGPTADAAYAGTQELLDQGLHIVNGSANTGYGRAGDRLRQNSVRNRYNCGVALMMQGASRDTILYAASLLREAENMAGDQLPVEALAARHGRGVAFYRAGLPDSARAIYNGLLEQGYFDTLTLRPGLEELLGLGGACYRTDTLGAVPLLSRRLTAAELNTLAASPDDASLRDVLLFMLPPATNTTLLGTTGDWQKVRAMGRSGYVPATWAGRPALSPCPPPAKKVDVAAVIARIQRNMVTVRGGTFTMGCTGEQGDDCDYDEKPAHQVTLSDYAISGTEVTVEQYMIFVNETGTHHPEWLEPGNEYNIRTGTNRYYIEQLGKSLQNPDCPIVGISWNDAMAYCEWLSRKTGRLYRLPTEAEWEYAARGGEKKEGKKYAGSDNVGEVAWYGENSGGKTHPVARKKPNGLGLYDMSGNVWEWCFDRWGDYEESDQPVVNPQGPEEGGNRVSRGGSWFNLAGRCRVSLRDNGEPVGRHFNLGFRLASPAPR